jgi:hypothetical protein
MPASDKLAFFFAKWQPFSRGTIFVIMGIQKKNSLTKITI